MATSELVGIQAEYNVSVRVRTTEKLVGLTVFNHNAQEWETAWLSPQKVRALIKQLEETLDGR